MRFLVAFSLALLVLCAGEAYAGPIIDTSEATFLANINPDFVVNVGLDQAGNPLGGTKTHDGSDIWVAGGNGIDVDFSTAGNSVTVTVADGHPELGPWDGAFWSGPLRIDFSSEVVAIGFGLHQLGGYTLELLDANGLVQSTTAAPGGIFNGIRDSSGFYGLIIDTNDTFWSLDGGQNADRMVGQTPEPAMLVLLGLGMTAVARRRRKNTA